MKVDSLKNLRIVVYASDARCKQLGDHLQAIGANVVRVITSDGAVAAIAGQRSLLVVDRLSCSYVLPGQAETLAECRRTGTLRTIVFTDEPGASVRGLIAGTIDEIVSPSTPATELVAKVSRLARDVARASTSGTHAIRGRARVLVVDDSEMLNRITLAILVRGGYHATCVMSPFETYACLAKETPDLMLIDYNMPLLRGDVVIDVVRHSGHLMPMLLYSSAPEAVLRRAAEESGATGYVLKGSPPEVILDRVAQALRDAGGQGQRRVK
jgi:DNA-binding response OmpR family regulator